MTVSGSVLERELRKSLAGEVRFDSSSKAVYSTDASSYRQVPIGIVIPKSREDVINAVKICRRYQVPVLARGGGTSLAGQCCNLAVVFDFSKYLNRILEIRPGEKSAYVEPGLVLDELRQEARRYELTFGPDPSTHNRCTLGGMIGNNSCGVHSVIAGRTADNVEELEILTYQGDVLRVGRATDEKIEEMIGRGGSEGAVYQKLVKLRNQYAERIRRKFPVIPRRVSGFNLDELLPEKGFHIARSLVGSEGTCAIVLSAKVRLIPELKHKVMLLMGFEDIYDAADHIPDVLSTKPAGLEGIDETLIENNKKKGMNADALKYFPRGKGWLITEFDGVTAADSCGKAESLAKKIKSKTKNMDFVIYKDHDSQQKVWQVRESGLGATVFVPGQKDTFPGWEDSSVPPGQMGNYLRELRKLMNVYGYEGSFYGHFGDGCLHTRMNFDLQSPEGIRKYRAFISQAADLVILHGGSLSGEHGDGQSRAELLPKMFGNDLMEAFREFKKIWDPQGKMNPGKVVDSYPVDVHLKKAVHLKKDEKTISFQFAADDGDFGRAVSRCVGVGKCRRHEEGTMCPSYMVTREEIHSTRGRARLLYEMLQGDVVRDGWKSEEVKEALDLCLACKGCKGECPVNVDMATYKAEFLSHYYRGRLRPVQAYALGRIDLWARLGSKIPGLVNGLTQNRFTGALAKKAAGIAQPRSIPAFAKETFRSWFFKNRSSKKRGKSPKVILWVDTFNNYFYPQVLKAALEVLEWFGYEVEVDRRLLCCGRPLYDYGMLGLARRRLSQMMTAFQDAIDDGVPFVALEPSCTAVFRDELADLFPHDERARKLQKNFFLFSEFIASETEKGKYPSLCGKALVHGHCHQKAIIGMESDHAVLSNLGLELEVPETGCCGMAGAFGFEREHYDLSVQCGERVLLPAVRDSKPTTLIVTNGFSCREQIRQMTGRQVYHCSEVFRMALDKVQK